MIPDPFTSADVETTGTDPENSRIVEIAMIRVDEAGRKVVRSLINPTIPIPPASTKVHGITDEKVKDAPTFREFILANKEVLEWLDVFVGHNIRVFDTPLIDAEFRRHFGRSPFDKKWPVIVDTLDIDRKIRPHTLEGAVEFYCGRPHAGAHGAEADAAAVIDVLAVMTKDGSSDPIAWHPPQLANHNAAELARWGLPEDAEKWVDRTGKFIRDDGIVCFNFGKHKDKPLTSERSYLEWMLGQTFPSDVVAIIREVLASPRQSALFVGDIVDADFDDDDVADTLLRGHDAPAPATPAAAPPKPESRTAVDTGRAIKFRESQAPNPSGLRNTTDEDDGDHP